MAAFARQYLIDDCVRDDLGVKDWILESGLGDQSFD